MDDPPAAQQGSWRSVLGVALQLGLSSFGGPIAHLGYFHREYVERRRWLDERDFADLVALCQTLPGPASSQLGIAIGRLRAGVAGALAAWVGFTLPSAVIMVGFALLAGSTDLTDAGWVAGLKLAAVAVVAHAVLRMSATLAPKLAHRLLALVYAGVLLILEGPIIQVGVLAAAALLGYAWTRGGRRGGPTARLEGRKSGVAALAVFGGLLVALPLLRAVDGQVVALVDTFYRAGSLVFGGGHVVLPLLDAGVVGPGWVGEDQFLAGYGLAQAIPGPLLTFSAYLGAVAAPEPNGVLGAGLALAAIFLPSFLLVFGVLPFWEPLRGSPRVRGSLDAVNVAVIGLLLAALYDPVTTAAVDSPLDAAVALGGLALLSLRLPPLAVVAAAAAGGQLTGA
ncbi:MAG TPA: chromate efflux transporter [Candidatus Limnocylindria bacterium]|nr:chromate efflux transporter [Candidatus Limnocylindria bacterium]